MDTRRSRCRYGEAAEAVRAQQLVELAEPARSTAQSSAMAASEQLLQLVAPAVPQAAALPTHPDLQAHRGVLHQQAQAEWEAQEEAAVVVEVVALPALVVAREMEAPLLAEAEAEVHLSSRDPLLTDQEAAAAVIPQRHTLLVS